MLRAVRSIAAASSPRLIVTCLDLIWKTAREDGRTNEGMIWQEGEEGRKERYTHTHTHITPAEDGMDRGRKEKHTHTYTTQMN